MYKMRLNIGDWSSAGHSIVERIEIEANHTIDEIQKAYLKTCELSKVTLHNCTDKSVTEVAVEYEDSRLSEEAYNKLKSVGCPLTHFETSNGEFDNDNNYIEEISIMVELFMDMVSLSLSDLEYRIIEPASELNGYDSGMNITIGYGLFV